MQEYLKFGCIELIYERIPAKKNFTFFKILLNLFFPVKIWVNVTTKMVSVSILYENFTYLFMYLVLFQFLKKRMFHTEFQIWIEHEI